jgi:hypothetical protein
MTRNGNPNREAAPCATEAVPSDDKSSTSSTSPMTAASERSEASVLVIVAAALCAGMMTLTAFNGKLRTGAYHIAGALDPRIQDSGGIHV